jgi:hypothetical protein
MTQKRLAQIMCTEIAESVVPLEVYTIYFYNAKIYY